jgi:hypothetical protein
MEINIFKESEAINVADQDKRQGFDTGRMQGEWQSDQCSKPPKPVSVRATMQYVLRKPDKEDAHVRQAATDKTGSIARQTRPQGQ